MTEPKKQWGGKRPNQTGRPPNRPGVKRIGFHCMVDPATKDLITRHAKRTSQSAGQIVDEMATRMMEAMQTHFKKWVIQMEGLIECRQEFEVGSDEREEFNAKQAELMDRIKSDPCLNAELLDWWRTTPKIVDELASGLGDD